jgi:hypothetical protein
MRYYISYIRKRDDVFTSRAHIWHFVLKPGNSHLAALAISNPGLPNEIRLELPEPNHHLPRQKNPNFIPTLRGGLPPGYGRRRLYISKGGVDIYIYKGNLLRVNASIRLVYFMGLSIQKIVMYRN